jgi:adenylate cyclase
MPDFNDFLLDDTGRTDDTERFHQAQLTAAEHIRHLHKQVTEVGELLKTQQDILRQKGMNLPPGVLDHLKGVRTQLDTLGKQFTNMGVELRQLRALAETAGLINSSLDTSDVLNRVMDTVIHLTGAERGYIVLKNPDTGELDFRVARGLDQSQLDKSDFVVSRGLVNDCATSGEAILTDNAARDDRYQGNQSVVGYQLRSILAVPLKIRDEVIGVVYCDNRFVVGLFKQHERDLLTAFANQAAVAIQNARLFEETQAQLMEQNALRELKENVFTSISSGVITLDGENIVTDCNAAVHEITGRTREQIINHPLHVILPPDAWTDELNEALYQVRAQGTREVVYIDQVSDGKTQRFWKLNLSQLRDPEHHNQGIAIVLDDLTQSRQRDEQVGLASRYLKVGVENIRGLVDEAQEREISVLHCDVRGFTTFSEKLEPEDLMTIINRYLSLSSNAIDLQGGMVEKYMGDAVTGLFNTQFNPQEDHAERCVRAAMSMMYDLFALHEVLPADQQLKYGIGVHTGMAVLGNVGGTDRQEFTALGDAMELAKLLQENALGGEVLLSEPTYERVKHVYECEPLEPRKSKGRADFTRMYRVIKLKRRTALLEQR